jgi:PAS domain S-box-containing protein
MSTAFGEPQVESRFRGLIENATDVIYWTDAYGHFTLVNPMAARLMRYPEDQLVGKHFTELVEPGHRAAAAAFYKRQFQQRHAHSYYEFPAVTGGGQIVWFGQNVRTLFEPSGRIAGFEAVARDITERKVMEGEREQLLAELKEALARVKVLRGLLPICSCCKMVRDDHGYWTQIDTYLREHTDAEFTHGLCPDCLQRYYREMDETT